jgi:hypothetical protein
LTTIGSGRQYGYWLREAMLASAKERLGAPPGEAKSNVTPFARPAKPGPKIT